MIPPAHQIDSDLSMNSVVLLAYRMTRQLVHPISGGGRSTPPEVHFDIVTDSGNRFITPVFLHAGIIHILLNMLALLTAGAQVNILICLLRTELTGT